MFNLVALTTILPAVSAVTAEGPAGEHDVVANGVGEGANPGASESERGVSAR
jgi:hypothetical protein